MKRLVAATAFFAVVLSPVAAHADDTTPRLAVVGDSITALYNDTPGDPGQGWWSQVAAQTGHVPATYAQGGSGYLHRANRTGSIFRERFDAVLATQPDILIVAGGRNDWRIGRQLAPIATTKRYILDSLKQLSTKAKASGLAASDIYIMSPWGSTRRKEASQIRPYMAKVAIALGFNWVGNTLLTRSQTTDGVHPNTAGNAALRDRVFANSNLDERFGA